VSFAKTLDYRCPNCEYFTLYYNEDGIITCGFIWCSHSDLTEKVKNQNQKDTKMNQTKRKLKSADDLFPSVYLKVGDVVNAGGRLTLTVARIELEQFVDPETKETEEKPVLTFTEGKRLILNKTNARRLGTLLGSDLDGWAGKQVTLIVEDVESFGKTVPAIRVN